MDHYHFCDKDLCQHLYEETLDFGRQSFARTGNPVHAWSQWRFHRRLGTPIPAWLVSYLDRCAAVVYRLELQALLDAAIGKSDLLEHLSSLRDARYQNIPRAISVGFGFTSERGKSSAFTQAAKELSSSLIGVLTAIEIGSGSTPTEAYSKLATRLGVDERTVERAYRQDEYITLAEQVRLGIEQYGRPRSE